MDRISSKPVEIVPGKQFVPPAVGPSADSGRRPENRAKDRPPMTIIAPKLGVRNQSSFRVVSVFQGQIQGRWKCILYVAGCAEPTPDHNAIRLPEPFNGLFGRQPIRRMLP